MHDLRVLMRRAKTFVFDFDGRLVGSNDIKWHGFDVTFAEFSDYLDEIRHYCQRWHHIQREEKFRYVYEQILRLPYTPEIAAVLHQRFSAATTRQIIEAPEVPGAGQLLAQLSGDRMTLLLSSTPHQVLLTIVEARGWREWFNVIQGAPVDKRVWLQAFRSQADFSKEEVVFFGDTAEDAQAAQAADCTFIVIGSDRSYESAVASLPHFIDLVAAWSSREETIPHMGRG